MQPLKRIFRATSLALSLTLSLPCPALAVRPEPVEGQRPSGATLRPQPDLAGLEEALHPESDIAEADGEETLVLRPSQKRNRVKKIAETLTWEELWSAYRQGRLSVPTPKSLSAVKMSDGKQGFFLRLPKAGVFIPWYALLGDRAVGGFRLMSGLDRKPGRFLRVFQPVHGDITQAVVALHERERPDVWEKLGTFGRERSGKPIEWSGIRIGMSADALGVLIRPTGAEPAFITDSLKLKPVSAQTARTLITHTAGLEEPLQIQSVMGAFQTWVPLSRDWVVADLGRPAPGYVRLSGDDLLNETLKRLPPFLAQDLLRPEFPGLVYQRFRLPVEKIEGGSLFPAGALTAVLKLEMDQKVYRLCCLTLFDIPESTGFSSQVQSFFLPADQLLTASRLGFHFDGETRRRAQAFGAQMQRDIRRALVSLPPDTEFYERLGLLHEMGGILWMALMPDFLKDPWKELYPLENNADTGTIYLRDRIYASIMEQRGEKEEVEAFANETFSDKFAVFILEKEEPVLAQLGWTLQQHEREYIQQVLDYLQDKVNRGLRVHELEDPAAGLEEAQTQGWQQRIEAAMKRVQTRSPTLHALLGKLTKLPAKGKAVWLEGDRVFLGMDPGRSEQALAQALLVAGTGYRAVQQLAKQADRIQQAEPKKAEKLRALQQILRGTPIEFHGAKETTLHEGRIYQAIGPQTTLEQMSQDLVRAANKLLQGKAQAEKAALLAGSSDEFALQILNEGDDKEARKAWQEAWEEGAAQAQKEQRGKAQEPEVDKALLAGIKRYMAQHQTDLRGAWPAYADELTAVLRMQDRDRQVQLMEKLLNLYGFLEYSRSTAGDFGAVSEQTTVLNSATEAADALADALVEYLRDPLRGQRGDKAQQELAAEIAQGVSIERLLSYLRFGHIPQYLSKKIARQVVNPEIAAARLQGQMAQAGGSALKLTVQSSLAGLLAGPQTGKLLLEGPRGVVPAAADQAGPTQPREYLPELPPEAGYRLGATGLIEAWEQAMQGVQSLEQMEKRVPAALLENLTLGLSRQNEVTPAGTDELSELLIFYLSLGTSASLQKVWRPFLKELDLRGMAKNAGRTEEAIVAGLFLWQILRAYTRKGEKQVKETLMSRLAALGKNRDGIFAFVAEFDQRFEMAAEGRRTVEEAAAQHKKAEALAGKEKVRAGKRVAAAKELGIPLPAAGMPSPAPVGDLPSIPLVDTDLLDAPTLEGFVYRLHHLDLSADQLLLLNTNKETAERVMAELIGGRKEGVQAFKKAVRAIIKIVHDDQFGDPRRRYLDGQVDGVALPRFLYEFLNPFLGFPAARWWEPNKLGETLKKVKAALPDFQTARKEVERAETEDLRNMVAQMRETLEAQAAEIRALTARVAALEKRLPPEPGAPAAPAAGGPAQLSAGLEESTPSQYLQLTWGPLSEGAVALLLGNVGLLNASKTSASRLEFQIETPAQRGSVTYQQERPIAWDASQPRTPVDDKLLEEFARLGVGPTQWGWLVTFRVPVPPDVPPAPKPGAELTVQVRLEPFQPEELLLSLPIPFEQESLIYYLPRLLHTAMALLRWEADQGKDVYGLQFVVHDVGGETLLTGSAANVIDGAQTRLLAQIAQKHGADFLLEPALPRVAAVANQDPLHGWRRVTLRLNPSPAAGLEERAGAREQIRGMLQELVGAGLTAQVVDGALAQEFPGLAVLAELHSAVRVDRSAGLEETNALVAELVSRDVRTASYYSRSPSSGRALRFQTAAPRAGIEVQTPPVQGFQALLARILASLSGLEEAAVTERINVGELAAWLDRLA